MNTTSSVVILTRILLKYYIGPKVVKWNQVSPHERYIQNVLKRLNVVWKEPSNSKSNVKEIKYNLKQMYSSRRNRIRDICDREYSRNNQLLKDSNELHGQVSISRIRKVVRMY